jgi:plant 4alpha-monomethylsterol monooxygenase
LQVGAMLEPLLDRFREYSKDPLFIAIPFGTLASALASIVVFMVPYTILAMRDPASLRKYKVQQELTEKQRKEQMDSIWPSVLNMLVNYTLSLVAFVAVWPLLRPYIRIHMDPSSLDSYYPAKLIGSLICFTFMEDTTFYCAPTRVICPRCVLRWFW